MIEPCCALLRPLSCAAPSSGTLLSAAASACLSACLPAALSVSCPSAHDANAHAPPCAGNNAHAVPLPLPLFLLLIIPQPEREPRPPQRLAGRRAGPAAFSDPPPATAAAAGCLLARSLLAVSRVHLPPAACPRSAAGLCLFSRTRRSPRWRRTRWSRGRAAARARRASSSSSAGGRRWR